MDSSFSANEDVGAPRVLALRSAGVLAGMANHSE